MSRKEEGGEGRRREEEGGGEGGGGGVPLLHLPRQVVADLLHDQLGLEAVHVGHYILALQVDDPALWRGRRGKRWRKVKEGEEGRRRREVRRVHLAEHVLHPPKEGR